jgi:hypothetical protein
MQKDASFTQNDKVLNNISPIKREDLKLLPINDRCEDLVSTIISFSGDVNSLNRNFGVYQGTAFMN